MPQINARLVYRGHTVDYEEKSGSDQLRATLKEMREMGKAILELRDGMTKKVMTGRIRPVV